MYVKNKGIGLAAIQIGYQKRMAVVDASKSQTGNLSH